MSGKPKISYKSALRSARTSFEALLERGVEPRVAAAATVEAMGLTLKALKGQGEASEGSPDEPPPMEPSVALVHHYRLRGLDGALFALGKEFGEQQVRVALIGQDDEDMIQARATGRVAMLSYAMDVFENDENDDGPGFTGDELATLVRVLRRIEAIVAPYRQAFQPPSPPPSPGAGAVSGVA